MNRQGMAGLVCAGLLALSGCSVGMALSGKPDPNLTAIHIGSTRGEVELQLGKPVDTVSLGEGARLDTYEFEKGNEPSPGRAVAHGVMDVLTLGLWEIAGTPIEAVQGDTYRVKIQYDGDDKVVAVNPASRTVTAPPPEGLHD